MNYLDFKDQVFSYANKLNISEYEIYIVIGASQSASVFNGEINSFDSRVNLGVQFKCRNSGKTGYASTQQLDKDEAIRIVDRALENSQFTQEDEFAALYKGENRLSNQQLVELESFEKLEKNLLLCEKAAKEFDKEIFGVSHCSGGESSTKVIIFNSTGLEKDRTFHMKHLAVSPSIKKGEQMFVHSEDEYTLKNSKLNPIQLGEKASKYTMSLVNEQPIKSGIYNVIFSNKAMTSLLGVFSGVFSAENAFKGHSLLKGKENQKIANECVSIIDSGICEDNGFLCEFDDQGCDVKFKNIVENGVLNTLLYNIKWANKLGKENTGNGFKAGYSSPVSIEPCSFYIEKGEKSSDELLKTLDNGVYITELRGLHSGANTATGDFSLDAIGFYIENGIIKNAIDSFVVSSNFYELLEKINHVGADTYFEVSSHCSNIGSPSVLAEKISIAGQ